MNTYKPIPGYEELYALRFDNVGQPEIILIADKKRNFKPGRIMKQKINRDGYKRIGLTDKNGQQKMHQVHRVVWVTLNGTIPAGLQINHIDGIKSNNNPKNLELVTPSENNLHARRVLMKCTGENAGRARPVIDVITGKKWGNIKDASKSTGINYTTLRAYLFGNRKNKTNLILC